MPFALRLLTALFLLTITLACNDNELPTPMDPDPAEIKDINFLALGDSYTIGTAVDESDRWPIQLADALRTTEPAFNTRTDIVAVNGWTTGDLINGINRENDLLAGYDLVSLLIGVNNQFRGLPLNQYRDQFEQLLETAISFAEGDTSRVIVVSIPDYGYTPFGRGDRRISEELDQFNATANFIADEYNVAFLNITPISREAEADPTLVASDNLHPSGKQYGRWVDEVILEVVKDKLQ